MAKRDPEIPAETIAVGEYPAMMTPAETAAFLSTVRNPETARRANRVVAAQVGAIGDAVLEYIKRLEAAVAASNAAQIGQVAHEIRGLAATAGMEASGRIADGLYKYLDAVARAGLIADPTVVNLHSSAIARAARATDDATRLGGKVAAELATLAAHKLQSVNGSKPPRG